MASTDTGLTPAARTRVSARSCTNATQGPGPTLSTTLDQTKHTLTKSSRSYVPREMSTAALETILTPSTAQNHRSLEQKNPINPVSAYRTEID
eukprot:3751604-Rhodomonas_salina.1